MKSPPTEDDQVLNWKVGPLLPGTACLFGGFYDLPSEFPTVIPSDGCGVPAPKSTGRSIVAQIMIV